MAKKYLWKSMRAGLVSGSGRLGPWKVGKWRVHPDKLTMCESGFHASENVIDAMRYVNAEVIAKVEVRGKNLQQDDKQCWSEMRVIQSWEWTKEDNMVLAIYAAELAIGIYENKYPDDKRPREAIETAKAWLKDPTEKNRKAAEAAAWAAEAAAEAARAAAWAAAWAAAEAAAEAAAWAAAEAAEAAARAAAWAAAWAAAEAAAWAASGKNIKVECHAFVLARLKEKEGK